MRDFPKTNINAVYFVNDHLKIRREDALRMWYGDKSKTGLDLDLSKEVVYSPTLTELIEACGLPFELSCDMLRAIGLHRIRQTQT
jgi:hypothetical protein